MIPVFEHEDFFVFDKPAGVSFHSENGAGFFAQLQVQYPTEALFPVHRLDRITSGLLLVARHKAAATELGQMFESKQIQKTYVALADQTPSKKQGTISGDMQRTRDGNWKLLRSRENPASTRFSSRTIAPNLRLFILKPLTGRTHQLRVMMKALGSPIIGDERYGGTPADRGYLHALQIAFDWRGENISVHCTPSNGALFQTLADYLAHTDHA
ncbi:MAG: TIGR01621 family pseudouridine synthase [Pseudomonadales bacterium]